MLDEILRGQALDELIGRVLDYLQQLKMDIEEDKVPTEEYVIIKVRCWVASFTRPFILSSLPPLSCSL